MKQWVLGAALALGLSSTSALAAVDSTADLVSVAQTGVGTWDFSVGGWAGGGLVTGSFTGDDLDGNGQLSWFTGEVSGFTMSYGGGAIVGAFGLGYFNLFGLVYDLDGGPLGDGISLDVEGIGAFGAGTGFLIGPGPFGLCGVGQICGQIEGPDAAVIPEPATWAMMIAGFGLVGAAVRRRKPVMA